MVTLIPEAAQPTRRTAIRKLILAAAFVSATTTGAQTAETITGKWRMPNGDIAAITVCDNAYCIEVTTGRYTGRQIGRFSGGSANFAGEITDPVEDRTYSGSGTLRGETLEMKGCVLAIFCRSQTWTRM